MKRGVEAFKNIVIAILSLTLILLIIAAVPGGDDAARRTVRSALAAIGLAPQDQIASGDYGTAAQPILISYRSGSSRASVYGADIALDAAYEAVTPFFAKALSTAADGMPVTDGELTAALQQSGIYLAFDAELPADVLAVWLGADKTVCTRSADAFLLSADRDTVLLYLCGTDAAAYQTGLSARELFELIRDTADDGTRFACETDRALSPRTFLPSGELALAGAQISNPCTLTVAQNIASALEFNPYGSGAYIDLGGSFVFSEAGRTCTVMTDGTVRLTADAGQYPAYRAETTAAVSYISAAQAAVQTVSADHIGAARWSLLHFERTELGAECTFCYHYQGIPVASKTAAVSFSATELTAMTVPICTFTASQSNTLPLPLPQAIALTPHDAQPQLTYRITESGTLSAEWKLR